MAVLITDKINLMPESTIREKDLLQRYDINIHMQLYVLNYLSSINIQKLRNSHG